MNPTRLDSSCISRVTFSDKIRCVELAASISLNSSASSLNSGVVLVDELVAVPWLDGVEGEGFPTAPVVCGFLRSGVSVVASSVPRVRTLVVVGVPSPVVSISSVPSVAIT